MSQRHSDSSLDEKLLEYRFHAELRLDANGNPIPGLPVVRSSFKARANAAFEPDADASGTLPPPTPTPPGDVEPRPIILSTQSPAALKMGTQQLIPKSLAVASKPKTKSPARHQSFGAAVLSKEAARRNPQLFSAPSFSQDDMDIDTVTAGNLKRNLRNQSYRAAMKGLGPPSSKGDSVQLGPKLQALAEEPPARHPAKHKVGACPDSRVGSVPRGPGVHWQRASLALRLSHLASWMATVTEPCWVQAPGHLGLIESIRVSLLWLEEVSRALGSLPSLLPSRVDSRGNGHS